jgi:phenylpyruvate tautomerase PptA (4-oxalocrotonate tautomerase family)
MPIVDVELVADRVPAGMAQTLADAAGEALGAPAGTTWVRLRALPPPCYAESGATVPKDALPVFVTVTKRDLPDRPRLVQEVDALTQAIARIVGRPPQRVHVEYAPVAAGRLAFGGKLVE